MEKVPDHIDVVDGYCSVVKYWSQGYVYANQLGEKPCGGSECASSGRGAFIKRTVLPLANIIAVVKRTNCHRQSMGMADHHLQQNRAPFAYPTISGVCIKSFLSFSPSSLFVNLRTTLLVVELDKLCVADVRTFLF